jgi:hypothetical protein
VHRALWTAGFPCPEPLVDPQPLAGYEPEPAIAGLAAASFLGLANPPGLASIEDSAAFLDAYQDARGCRWTPADLAVCWAAGLWQRAFDAKVQSLGGDPEQVLTRHEARARLRLAGLDPDLVPLPVP